MMPALAAGKIGDGFVGAHDHEGIVLRPTLSLRHTARWAAAKRLFENLIRVASQNGAMLMFNGTLIETSQIVITDDGVYVDIENSRYIQYEAKPDWDHGLYSTIGETEAMVREKFVIVKKLEY